MNTQQLLRYGAFTLIFVGLLGLAASFESGTAVFPLAGDTAFVVGLALCGVGVAVLANLGRRAREAATTADGES